MTDREMLLLAYGAIRSIKPEPSLNTVVSMMADHLFPPPKRKRRTKDKIRVEIREPKFDIEAHDEKEN